MNYDRFNTNWDSASAAEKQAACQEFFDNNPPATDIVLDGNSTGPEIVAWFQAAMNVVLSLAKDTSNIQNEAVAQKLAGCLSVSHDPTNEGPTWLVDSVTNPEPDTNYDSIVDVTEYGKFTATDYQNVSWNVVAIAGNARDYGNTPLYQIYEYDEPANPSRSTIVYRLSLSEVQSTFSDLTSNPSKYFGPNPVSVNQ